MAYESRSISNTINTDATFRTWGSTVSDLWQDVGLTKTADTGQIDWTTVTRPASTGFAGYEIFKLDTDTQHSSFGLFIRVDYGCVVTGASYYQRLGIQIGSSTNGAGTLSGITGTQRIFAAAGTSSSSLTHYCSSGDGYFAYAGAWSAGTNSTTALFNQVFVIERLRDNTGAPTANGIYTFFGGVTGTNTSDGYTQIIRSDDLVTAYATSSSGLRLGGYVPNLSGNRGTDLYLYTHQPADYAIYNPCLSNLFYYSTDLTAGVDITVSMYGTNRTFKPLGNLGSASAGNWPSYAFQHSNAGLAIRWE